MKPSGQRQQRPAATPSCLLIHGRWSTGILRTPSPLGFEQPHPAGCSQSSGSSITSRVRLSLIWTGFSREGQSLESCMLAALRENGCVNSLVGSCHSGRRMVLNRSGTCDGRPFLRRSLAGKPAQHPDQAVDITRRDEPTATVRVEERAVYSSVAGYDRETGCHRLEERKWHSLCDRWKREEICSTK